MGRNKTMIRVWQVLGNAVLLLIVFIMVMPYVYMISASFKPGAELFTIPFRLFPESLYLGNYELLFGRTNFMRWFFNSVFIGVSRMALAIAISLMAGYAFAKYDFRGKNVLFFIIIASLMLPIYVLLVPLYSMMITLGWINSYLALIVPLAAQAIGVFLSRQYLLSIPDDLLEAARIDGAGEWGIFWRIIVPMAQPAIAVMGILFFTASWNDFIWPLIVLSKMELYTLPLGIATMFGPYEIQYGTIMAGSFLSTVPIVVVFLAMQEQFESGLMVGALKG